MSKTSFDWVAFYYEDILKALQANRRRALPQLNDFNEYTPEVQLERMMALVGHLINVNLDIVANESFLPSAQLLQSILNIGASYGFPFSMYSPAKADVVGKVLVEVGTPTVVVPARSRFSAPLADGSGTLAFENIDAVTLSDSSSISILYYSSNMNKFFDDPYLESKAPGDCLYFGSELMSIKWDFALALAQAQLNGVWEYWDGLAEEWTPVPKATDGTNQLSTDGTLEFQLPQALNSDWSMKAVNGINRYWLRWKVVGVGYLPTLPVVDVITTSNRYIKFQVSQGETFESPFQSDGLPNQVFSLPQQGLVEGSLEHIYITEGSTEDDWTRVESFAVAGPADKVFRRLVDADGNIVVALGDGSNGKVPRPGAAIRIPYRVVPPTLNGNAPAKAIQDSSGNALVISCFNPRAAAGFREAFGSEELLRAQIPAWVCTNARAVSLSDILFYLLNSATTQGGSPVMRANLFDEGFGAKTVKACVVGANGDFLDANTIADLEDRFNNKADGIMVANKQLKCVNYDRRTLVVSATVWGGNRVDMVSALLAALNPLSTRETAEGQTVYRWNFGGHVSLSYIISVLQDVEGVEKVVLAAPATDIWLGNTELPWLTADNINITLVEG